MKGILERSGLRSADVKARYLGIIFIAAVLVPSILLSVLSIRSAGREEAYVEKQLTATLLAEVTHAVSQVTTAAVAVASDLHASVSLPAGAAFSEVLSSWRKKNALVGVPFLLSPRYGILWPDPNAPADDEERTFLKENGDFLSDRSATAIYANIAVVHKEEVLAGDDKRKDLSAGGSARASAAAVAPPAASPAQPESVPTASEEPSALESQQALDAFAQSPAVQARVYEKARKQGERLNARVVQPTSKALQQTPANERERPGRAPVPTPTSAYITTSRLLSQIASQGEYGIIPRFIGEKLTFLFWNRERDGRIVGCEISAPAFRERVAAALPSTWSPVRILTVLDEKGQPLAAPAGPTRDWRRPFVSQEIGEPLPRWEVASYLTDPGSISAQARSASAVIWILVLILFVSVAGGGTMVLTSVYGEMRMAQKKATFVANVSHELKTPLTSISLFVDLLRRSRRTDPQKRDRYLALMAAETERLGRLINNVLDFSSLEKGRKKYAMRAVSLAQVAEEVLEGQRVRLEGLGFSVSFLSANRRESPKQAFVHADPEALKQVLINLLSNAEKYSPRKKEIEVEVSRSGSEAAAHVRDRGIGVAEKDRERIFHEFVRVDDSLSARVPGTGLGLTIARRIARDHGGDLSCSGREEGGSDFALTLPAVPGEER